jgi:O-antigen/teichoic acid export membrane protein
MESKKRFALNVGMNWAAMVVGMLVPFFLTPLVIRSLGPVAYGVWILAVSTVSYLNLLDLGLRSAIVRFVCAADAQGKIDDVKKVVGTALWLRLLIAVAVVALSVILSLAFPHMFKVPHDLGRAAQITVLLCALGVAITLMSSVFNGVLASMQRFDLLSSITVIQTVIKASGVILILRSGRGLVSLAYWEFVVVAVTGLITVGVAFKIYPPCRVGVSRRPDTATLKMLWSHSVITFIWSIAAQIILYTDNVVIGAFLGVGLVAYYAIGGSLVLYSSQVVSALSTTFVPMASRLDASGNTGKLRTLLLRGCQASLAIMFPISLSLFFRGKTFIGLWMGQQYSQTAGTVLQILLISQFFSAAGSTPSSLMMAIGKHKPVAIAASISAALNLFLSIVLIKTVGLYGVAWGTSIATTIVQLSFWPRYARKVLGVPIRTYVWNCWSKVTVCSIPFGIVCAAADRFWHPHSLVTFFAQVLVTLPVYAISLFVTFRSEAMILFKKWQNSKLVRSQAVL